MKTPLHKNSFFAFCLFFATIVDFIAQNADYKQYTSANGLLSDKVYNIYQDKSGYLWIFSEFGTLKYNGEDFQRVLKNLPISEAFIYSVYEREDGRIWVANSNANVYEIVNDTAVKLKGFEETSALLRKNVSEIIKLSVNDLGDVYIVTKLYSYKLKNKSSHFEAENLTHKIIDDSVKINLIEINGELLPVQGRKENDEFLSSGQGKQQYLSFVNSDRKIRVQYEAYTVLFRHFRKKGNQIYYTKANKLGIVRPNNSVIEIAFDNTVLNFKFDKNGHTWIGLLNGGLVELNENDSIVGRLLQGITVNDIAIDFQNGVWASTNGAGLFRFNNTVLEEFRKVSANTSVIYLSENNGILTIVNARGELFCLQEKKASKLKNSDAQTIVSCTMGNNVLYVSYPHSLEKVNLSAARNKPENYLSKSPKFNKLYWLGADTLLGVWRRGISVLYNKVNQKYVDFGCRVICSAYANDTIWLGTEHGLFFRKVSTIAVSKHVDFEAIATKEEPAFKSVFSQFNKMYISALFVDGSRNLWFAVKGQGLYCCKGGEVKKVSAPDVEYINSIEIIGEKAILCTNKGAFANIAQALTQPNSQRWFKIEEREIQQAFTFNSKLYLFGSGSILEAKGLNNLPSTQNIIFRFKDVTSGGDFLSESRHSLIPHYFENLKFNFERITYSSTLPQLHFELSGKVTQSGLVKSSFIELNRLPIGSYRLKVYPEIYGGEAAAITLSFRITPKWYETWIARAFAIICVLIAIGFVVIFMINRNKRKVQQQNQQEQLLLEYKLIALKAQVNPHFISNCLTAIQNLITKGESEQANAYVAKFGLLVRKILDYSGMPLITLKEELQVVKLYIDMEEVRFGRSFTFNISIQSEIDVEDCMMPSLLLNPIIENAIWHGLLPLANSRKAELSIEISKEAGVLKLIIRDNGVGLSEIKQVEESRKSYGLEITQQRLKNINYLLQSTAGKVEIQNLTGNTGQILGVEVVIWLPLENKY